MAEVLGVVAAATQLAALSFSLVDILKDAKEAPKTLRAYRQQLDDLNAVATSISQNPLLQTDEVKQCIHRILALQKDLNLDNIITENRARRAIYLLCNEKRILKIFHEVEQHKSSLDLAIGAAGSTALYGIHDSITELSKITKKEEKYGRIEHISLVGDGDKHVGFQFYGGPGAPALHTLRNSTVINEVSTEGNGNVKIGHEFYLSEGVSGSSEGFDFANLVGHISNVRTAGSCHVGGLIDFRGSRK